MSAGKACAGPTRDSALDVTRGIAMVLVVMGHNPVLATAHPMLTALVFLFHVPAFLFLSGQLARPVTGLPDIARLARRLLVPALLVALLLAGAKLALRGGDAGAVLLGILWGTGASLPSSQLWFLPLLFLTLLTTGLILRLSLSRGALLLLAAGLGLLGALALHLPQPGLGDILRQTGSSGPAGWPWSIDLLPLALAFALAGHVLARDPRRAALPWGAIAAGLGLCLVMLWLGMRTDLNLRRMDVFPLGMIAAGGGILALLGLGQKIAGRRLGAGLGHLGRCTLALLLWHVTLQNAALRLLGGSEAAGWAALALAVAGSLLLSQIWARMGRRRGPRRA